MYKAKKIVAKFNLCLFKRAVVSSDKNISIKQSNFKMLKDPHDELFKTEKLATTDEVKILFKL